MATVRSHSHLSPGRLGRVSIVLFAVGIMAIAYAIALWRVTQDRRVTLAASRQELSVFASALGNQIEAMLADGVGAAIAGAGAMRAMPPGADPGQMLREMLTGGDYVRALFVIQDGRTSITSRLGEEHDETTLPPATTLEQARRGVWFGDVREQQGALVLPVARRIPGASGGNWAGALIRISDLDSVYEQLERLDISVALVTLDGLGLVQLPLAGGTMRNLDVSGSEIYRMFMKLPQRPLTLVDGPHYATGEPRLHAIYRMRGLPAVATAGRSFADALAGWRARTAALATFLSLWTLAVLGLAIGLQLLYNRRWQHLQRLAVAQEQLAEARRAELAARQSQTRELLVAQERERSRLASELHDGLGQNLSLLRNRVVLLKRTSLPPAAHEHAEALLDLATETIEDLRGVAHNLRPMHLEELGLTGALKALVERVELASELHVHARVEDVDDVLRGEAAVHMYRIAQEAINNVLRHAGARNLWLDVIRDIDRVEMRVRDDGRGIAGGAARSKGLGLSSISERCGILGGTFMLQQATPAGTLASVTIPLRADADPGPDGTHGGRHG